LKISVKLLGCVLAIFVAAFAVLAYVLDYSTRSVLLARATQQLESARRSRSVALSGYFETSSNALTLAAGGVTPEKLLREGSEAFERLPAQLDTVQRPEDLHARLRHFYDTEVGPRMLRGRRVWRGSDTYLQELTPAAIALQSEYLLPTPHRHTDYDDLHAQYHSRVVTFARPFNWYDVLLATTDGTIVYSMRKNIELGTNLRTGIFRTTALGTVFVHALEASIAERPYFADYEPYEPAFGAPMGFLGTPVFGVHKDQLLGVILAVMPLSDVQKILAEHTHDETTQTTYLVGRDGQFRTGCQAPARTPSSALDAAAVRPALAGEQGTTALAEDRGREALASFTPLAVGNVRWALVTMTNLSDVLSPARQLDGRIAISFLMLSVIGCGLLVLVLRRVVLTPIQSLTEAARRAERGDFGSSVEVRGADEMGELGRAMNRMMQSVGGSLTQTQARLAASQVDLHQVSARLNTAREHERARLARDVHDHLGQSLTALKMDVTEVRRRLHRGDRAGIETRLAEMDSLIDASLGETRRLAFELRPPILDEVSIDEAMRGYVLDFARRSGIRSRFDARRAADGPDVAADRASALFRILQEALTNVARHAAAQRVDVQLIVDHEDVMLMVSDDGRGIDSAVRHVGLGLTNMRDRALLLGGDVSVESGPDAGTTVVARVPVCGEA